MKSASWETKTALLIVGVFGIIAWIGLHRSGSISIGLPPTPPPPISTPRFELIYRQHGEKISNKEGELSEVWDLEVLHDRKYDAEITCVFLDRTLSCFPSGRSGK